MGGKTSPQTRQSRPLEPENGRASWVPSFKATFLLTIISLLIALIVQQYFILKEAWDNEEILNVHKSLLKAAEGYPMSHRKVAIGLGSCRDVFVDSIELFKEMEIPPSNKKHHHTPLSDLEELEETFNYFFSKGIAAERYFSDPVVFKKKLVDAVLYMSPPFVRYALGGNAPVMGKRFAESDWSVLLGANLVHRLEKDIPKNMELAGKIIDYQDTHLLLEYKNGARWGDFVAPRANRFVIHNDLENPYLKVLDRFEAAIEKFKPDLVVMSGLQMMDNYPYAAGEVEMLLLKLERFMKGLPKSGKVHFEMASFIDQRLFQEMMVHVMRYSESLGMNEQELANLHSMLTVGEITHTSEAYPDLKTVLSQSRHVFHELGKTKEVDGKRRLKRIHVHTIGFQLLITLPGQGWAPGRHAVAAASLMGFSHTCGHAVVNASTAAVMMDLVGGIHRGEGVKIYGNVGDTMISDKEAVVCWDESYMDGEERYEVCVSVNLVCRKVTRTTGGGDNISAIGLVMQL